MPNWTDEEDLRFTVEMALSKMFTKGPPLPRHGHPRKAQGQNLKAPISEICGYQASKRARVLPRMSPVA
jgi:hypothetical protein